MFALGIFVSPLPYAVVVAFYAVYLLLVHVNDSHDKQELLVNDSGKHIEIDDGYLSAAQVNTFFVAKSQFDDSKILPSADGLFTSSDVTATDCREPSGFPAWQESPSQFLVEKRIAARPPPVI